MGTAEHGDPDGPEGPVQMEVDIVGGRTVITVSGDRDAAVIVRSESGERIYLPPEDFDRPVEPARQSPYDGTSTQDGARDGHAAGGTPYAPSQTRDSPGMESTADGFSIVHPEPVTDVRLLR